ncbi:MAG: glycosyltransferase family 39 protein [Candidatus Altiarchaeota archaeon]
MNEKKIRILLLAVFMFQAIQLVYWIHADARPPSWDQAWHAMISITQYNYFTGHGMLSTVEAQKVYPILSFVKNFYPPGYHTTTMPLYLLFGLSYDTAVATNLAYLCILVLSSYAIGRKLKGQEAGILTALIASTVPVYSILMRDYLIDFPLAAMVAAGLATLLYSENFADKRYTLLFGAVSGLATLIKWNYILYIWAPAILSFIILLKDTVLPTKDYGALKPAAASILLALMIASLWYTPLQLSKTIPLVVDAAFEQGRVEGEPTAFTLKGATYYLSVILRDYSLLYFLLTSAGIALLAGNPARISDKRALLLVCVTVIAIYLSVTFLWNKNNRYAAPIYAPLAALAAAGLSTLKDANGRRIKKAVAVLVIVHALAYNSSVIDSRIDYGGLRILDFKGNYPSHADTDIKSLLDVMNSSSRGEPFTACVIAEAKFVNDINLPYYAFRDGYPVKYMIGNGCDSLAFDYAVAGPIEETWRTQLFKNSEATLNGNIRRFSEVYSSGEVKVYKKIS